MIPDRTARARTALRALAMLGAAAVAGLVWAPAPPPPTARATPVDLGPYALADSGFLGFPVAPPPPGTVRAVPHDRSAYVTWDAARPNTSTVRSYRVYVDGVQRGPDVPAPRTSTMVLGLTNYQQQQITVHTIDSDPRESGDSNGATVTPFDDAAPSPVTGLVAMRGDGRATLTWESESATESDRAGVRVYVDGSLRTSLPTATTRYEVTGLSNDVEHTFYLVAFDARPAGYGPPGSVAPNASEPSATVRATPGDLTPPSPPTAFAAVRGDTTAALTWTAPPETDVGRYDVIDEDGVLLASFAAPATSGTVTAMTDGRAYRLRLVAVDTHGNHSPASAGVTVTPLAPPVAITGLVLTMDRDVPVLAWTAPALPVPTGHEAAVDVVVHRVGAGGAPDTAVAAPLPAGTTTYRVTGLAPGEAASFFLTARDGDPRESPRSDVVSTRLGAPTGVRAIPDASSVTVSWTAVSSAGGGYRVEQSPDAAGGPWTAVGTSSGTSLAVSGLTDGTRYRFRVVALPASGQESVPSPAVTVTVGRAPIPSTVPAGGSGASGAAVTRDERHALLETRTSTSDARPALVLADLLDGTRTVIAQQPSGPGGDQTFRSGTRIAAVALSEDGRQVAVATTVAVDAARDRNGTMDVYRYDATTATWSLVSAPRGGATGATTGIPGSLSANDPTLRPQIAVSDAGDVFFTSERTDLVTMKVAGVAVRGLNVFVQRLDGSIELASDATARPLEPSKVGGGPASFAITPDGTTVVYVTGERRAAGTDLLRHGVVTGVSTVLSLPTDKDLNHRSGQLAVSDDGTRAVYSRGSGSAIIRLAVLDPSTGALGVTTVGTSAQALAQVGIAPDGTAVFFATVEALVAPDDKGSVDVFRVLPDGTGPQRVTQPVSSPPVDSVRVGSYGPVRPLSTDRVLVVTLSALVAGDGNGASDAYLAALAPGGARPVVGAP